MFFSLKKKKSGLEDHQARSPSTSRLLLQPCSQWGRTQSYSSHTVTLVQSGLKPSMKDAPRQAWKVTVVELRALPAGRSAQLSTGSIQVRSSTFRTSSTKAVPKFLKYLDQHGRIALALRDDKGTFLAPQKVAHFR